MLKTSRFNLRALAIFSLVLAFAAPAVAAAQWGPYGPYPYGPYGRYGLRDDLTASLRLEVKPREAEVYVDGYRAGIVDDFDGIFQRLHVRAGGHQIALYLDGYKTETQDLYLDALSTRSIKLTMVQLPAGETSGPRPTPMADPTIIGPESGRTMPRMPVRRLPPSAPQPPPEPQPAPEAPRFGSVSIRLIPVNADVVVDGERWRSTNALEPLVIQLSEGKHRVEVTRDGYEKFSTDVDIKAGETVDLNVSLKKIR